VPLALLAAAIVLVALLWQLALPRLHGRLAALRERPREPSPVSFDPGRELRAEQRARALLRSCVNQEEWEMYRDLGFLRVWGGEQRSYAYLIYPHWPIVAYLPDSGRLLNEYCVSFQDPMPSEGATRLPDADDVLAKWMALTADEHVLISGANMHLPGRQIDPARVRRDLLRLGRWEREQLALA
jgi:hypothetical protein